MEWRLVPRAPSPRHAGISVWTLGGWLASQLQLAVGSRLEACLASRQRAEASVNSLAW